jgi:hypothetical protein
MVHLSILNQNTSKLSGLKPLIITLFVGWWAQLEFSFGQSQVLSAVWQLGCSPQKTQQWKTTKVAQAQSSELSWSW